MHFFELCKIIDIIIAISIYFVYCVPKWIASTYALFLKTCLYIYGFFVLYFTCIIPIIIPIPFFNINISYIHVNLVPFIDYMNSNGDFIKQIILNVLMLVPFGIMFPFIYKKNLKNTVLAGLLVSMSIELVQLFSVRQFSSCDITDVITNVIGTCVGYAIFKCFNKPVEKILKNFFSNKQFKKYNVSKGWKKALTGLILIQLIIRSILVVFI